MLQSGVGKRRIVQYMLSVSQLVISSKRSAWRNLI